MTRHLPSVAVVRGVDLNPFEMQAYRPLADDFDLLLIGRRNPAYEVTALGLPVRLLAGADQHRLAAAAARRLARFDPRAGPGRLIGLNSALAGYDIVHGAETAIPLSAQAAEFTARSGAKLVLTCWENIAFRFDEDPEIARRKRIVQRACDLFLAVTPSARNALLAEGVDDSRITVVPAAVDTARFAPAAPSSELDLRAQLRLPQDALLIVFVGRLIQEKGVAELVQAFARLPRDDARPVHLVLAGNGPQGPRVDSAAAALRCADRVHSVGGVGYARVPDLYRSADIVVAPSLPTPYWQEQFGMVLAEAMASGRAVVTSSSGSIPEVVGDAAMLVAPYDVAALSDALRRLVADPRLRREYAEAGRARVEKYYAVDVVAPQLRAAYERLLALR